MCGQAASNRSEFVGCLVYQTEVGPHPTAEGSLVAARIGVYSFMLAYRVPNRPTSSYLNNLVVPHPHLICCVPKLSSVRLFCQTIFWLFSYLVPIKWSDLPTSARAGRPPLPSKSSRRHSSCKSIPYIFIYLFPTLFYFLSPSHLLISLFTPSP